jgi:hypothetical protein
VFVFGSTTHDKLTTNTPRIYVSLSLILIPANLLAKIIYAINFNNLNRKRENENKIWSFFFSVGCDGGFAYLARVVHARNKKFIFSEISLTFRKRRLSRGCFSLDTLNERDIYVLIYNLDPSSLVSIMYVGCFFLEGERE